MLLIILAPILLLSLLVMVPSSFATWYSRCLNIRLSYGFGLVFSVAILSVILGSLSLPADVKQIMFSILTLLLSILIIYGVYRQFTGKCNLGIRINRNL